MSLGAVSMVQRAKYGSVEISDRNHPTNGFYFGDIYDNIW